MEAERFVAASEHDMTCADPATQLVLLRAADWCSRFMCSSAVTNAVAGVGPERCHTHPCYQYNRTFNKGASCTRQRSGCRPV